MVSCVVRLSEVGLVEFRKSQVIQIIPKDGPWLSLLQAAILISPENGMMRWPKWDIERVIVRLGTPGNYVCLS